mmetsp:Transcript_3205/g.3727  ORF Transcript_3205/g.3727 Transcript_3205/m.3727 type:complete len:255 (+) Transcript_3205:68-832(+)
MPCKYAVRRCVAVIAIQAAFVQAFVPRHHFYRGQIITTRTSTTSQPDILPKTFQLANAKSSFILKEFNDYQDLETIIQLSSQPLPQRPDGIVTVAKYSSATRQNCVATEDEYERLARAKPASLFLRCFEEYENAAILFAKANIVNFPTYDVFYGGNRVARVEGDMMELERVIDMYQLQNSDLDLFSEESNNNPTLAWGDGRIKSNVGATPRTTARFIPGYDWNKDGGAFDEAAQKAEDSFEDTYGNWLPNMDDK